MEGKVNYEETLQGAKITAAYFIYKSELVCSLQSEVSDIDCTLLFPKNLEKKQFKEEAAHKIKKDINYCHNFTVQNSTLLSGSQQDWCLNLEEFFHENCLLHTHISSHQVHLCIRNARRF